MGEEACAEEYRLRRPGRSRPVALARCAVAINFGLSDRYTWLQEDFPRRDGAARRPLPFDDHLQPKPAYNAILQAFANAPARTPI